MSSYTCLRKLNFQKFLEKNSITFSDPFEINIDQIRLTEIEKLSHFFVYQKIYSMKIRNVVCPLKPINHESR